MITIPNKKIQIINIKIPIQKINPYQLKLQHTLNIHPTKQNNQ